MGLPAGGFFVLADVADLASELPCDSSEDSVSPGRAVARFFLRQLKVAVVPGDVYGPSGASCIRIVFAVEEDDLNQAIDRFATQLTS